MDQNSPKIWILIVVIIVIIAVAWFMFGRPERASAPSETSDISLNNLEAVSQSDEVAALDKELRDTDLSNLTPELDAIDREIGQ
ncbi:MAG: hypothetical protein Q8R12_02865 [bacterium]|nr:hypothetical protein [bacterium]